jgi:hypothetical protein
MGGEGMGEGFNGAGGAISLVPIASAVAPKNKTCTFINNLF